MNTSTHTDKKDIISYDCKLGRTTYKGPSDDLLKLRNQKFKHKIYWLIASLSVIIILHLLHIENYISLLLQH